MDRIINGKQKWTGQSASPFLCNCCHQTYSATELVLERSEEVSVTEEVVEVSSEVVLEVSSTEEVVLVVEVLLPVELVLSPLQAAIVRAIARTRSAAITFFIV